MKVGRQLIYFGGSAEVNCYPLFPLTW